VNRFEDRRMTTGGVAFSPDGKWLATGHMVRVGEKRRYFGYVPGGYAVHDYDYVVHIRELASGEIVQSIAGWQQGIRHLMFSPDGKFLAGTAGPRLRIWDLEGQREAALHKRGTKHFQGLAFTADGRYLATVSNDETVRIWETNTWQEHTTFTWKIGALLNIALSPEGLRAAAGSDKGQIVIWDLEE
jgi:WD40 repeat protein